MEIPGLKSTLIKVMQDFGVQVKIYFNYKNNNIKKFFIQK